MFKNLSLRIKLSLAFLIVASLVGAFGYYQVNSVSHINSLFLGLTDHDFKRQEMLEKAKTTAAQLENSALQYDQSIEEGVGDRDLSVKKAALGTISATLSGYLAGYHELLKESPRQFAPESSATNLVNEATELARSADSFIEAAHAQSSTKLASQRAALEKSSAQLGNDIDALSKLEQQHAATQGAEVDDSVGRLITTSILVVAAVVVLAMLLGLVLASSISRSLGKLKEGAKRLANGDFSQKIPIKSSDEIGRLGEAFNVMAERLRESYQRMAFETERDRTLLESLGEGLITIDEKAKVVLINSKAIQLLELDEQKVPVGSSVSSVLAIYNQQDKLLPVGQTPAVVTLKSAAAVSDVFGFHKKDGSKLLIDVSASPVVVEGKVAGAIMTLRDVTKEKEIDRMKTEFISLASHQLRTPLSAIRWFTEMLLAGDAGKLKPEQADFAQNISDSTDRMIALVNALLNISRIESGRIMIAPKPTDLRELVSGIVNDLKAKTEEKKQSLIISVHADLPKINLDPQLIGQVYLNLLTNAIKYTPKGGEISVFISKKDDQVISQITDNGYGIPKNQQDRVFQKFFRAANAVKVETDGTGLGLYLIKAVIESSGGKIWFESEENKGTTFWFSIPLSGMKPKKGEVTLDA